VPPQSLLPLLPAALERHAAADPEEPWLFRAEGWDWVWHPWGELAGWRRAWSERIARLGAELPDGLPAGSRVAFRYCSDPSSVILDLGVQAAGLASVPVSDPAQRRAGDAWIDFQGNELRLRPGEGRVADVVVDTDAALAAAAERVGEAIGPNLKAKQREIVVLGGPLGEPTERAMLTWATLTGAAVVLEPDPALRATTAAWVRPTVFHGTPGEIADLRSRVKERGKRRPFRRLRTLLVTGTEGLGAEEAAWWEGRGVGVRGFPPLPQSGVNRGI
jgi:hypothetical protein